MNSTMAMIYEENKLVQTASNMLSPLEQSILSGLSCFKVVIGQKRENDP